MDKPEGKNPMIAACGSEVCNHVWVVVWLPMAMDVAAKVMMAARCPLCGSPKVMMVTSSQIEAAGLISQ